MAYIKIDGYLCERCWHRWAPKQQGTPELPEVQKPVLEQTVYYAGPR